MPVLRADLITEQLVIRATNALVKNPRPLSKATRLPFPTRVLFLRSLMPAGGDGAFRWRSIDLLNESRNDQRTSSTRHRSKKIIDVAPLS